MTNEYWRVTKEEGRDVDGGLDDDEVSEQLLAEATLRHLDFVVALPAAAATARWHALNISLSLSLSLFLNCSCKILSLQKSVPFQALADLPS